MRRLALTGLAALTVAACALGGDEPLAGPAGTATPPVMTGDAVLAKAFEQRVDDLEVEGRGTVVGILADDTEGDRHQRFIVRLASGQTLLVAHNIDVAPRVEDLREGAAVAFRGVYEWNDEGGTIHWTHHDPQGKHAPGWIRCGGRGYQ